ncbi:MAG: 4-(cytidine 5-diphospho)-2-C-methyl-D-erythritol kinase, partial [Frankiales bacterium]|nr:4-(cytidine 5-diphospho)-2-C-methyl-D-erythritol kinase [Frankiales bacterium]
SDGRHQLVSVMQAVDLCDEVTVSAGPADGPPDLVQCVGVSGANIADAALQAFRAHTGQTEPVSITITKAIPVAAGMAGGSADAGAVLRLLDEHFDTGLPGGVLRRLAATLGADVPAQVWPGRYLATGAGELVEEREGPARYGVVVLPHAEPLSTPAVYREFDRLGLARSSDELAQLTEQVRAAADDLPDALVVNDLQRAATALCPAIEDNLQRMRAAGADIALVSGSGPTVLGLTRTVAAAGEVARRVGKDAIAVATVVDAVKVTPA